jgi:hypothetical protein
MVGSSTELNNEVPWRTTWRCATRCWSRTRTGVQRANSAGCLGAGVKLPDIQLRGLCRARHASPGQRICELNYLPQRCYRLLGRVLQLRAEPSSSDEVDGRSSPCQLRSLAPRTPPGRRLFSVWRNAGARQAPQPASRSACSITLRSAATTCWDASSTGSLSTGRKSNRGQISSATGRSPVRYPA